MARESLCSSREAISSERAKKDAGHGWHPPSIPANISLEPPFPPALHGVGLRKANALPNDTCVSLKRHSRKTKSEDLNFRGLNSG